VRTRVVRQGDNALSFFVASGHTLGLL